MIAVHETKSSDFPGSRRSRPCSSSSYLKTVSVTAFEEFCYRAPCTCTVILLITFVMTFVYQLLLFAYATESIVKATSTPSITANTSTLFWSQSAVRVTWASFDNVLCRQCCGRCCVACLMQAGCYLCL